MIKENQNVEISMISFGINVTIATNYKDMMKRRNRFFFSKKMNDEEKKHLHASLKSRLLKHKECVTADPNEARLNYRDVKSYIKDCLTFVALNNVLFYASIPLVYPPKPHDIYNTDYSASV